MHLKLQRIRRGENSKMWLKTSIMTGETASERVVAECWISSAIGINPTVILSEWEAQIIHSWALIHPCVQPICYQGSIYLNGLVFPWPPARMSWENCYTSKKNMAHLLISSTLRWPLKQLTVLSSSKCICFGAGIKQIVGTLCMQRKLTSSEQKIQGITVRLSLLDWEHWQVWVLAILEINSIAHN